MILPVWRLQEKRLRKKLGAIQLKRPEPPQRIWPQQNRLVLSRAQKRSLLAIHPGNLSRLLRQDKNTLLQTEEEEK